MINIKVKYNKKNSKVFIESTIVLPFLPLVDHEITLDDNNKTIIKVKKINHCVEHKIITLVCEEIKEYEPPKENITMGR